MISLTFALVGLAAQVSTMTPPNPDWNCDDPMAQQEMNRCAERDYVEADAALNAQWITTKAVMKARDKELEAYRSTRDSRPGYFESLLKAQRAWLTYREAHCRLEGYVARGGSLEPLLVSTCKTALTKSRTQDLRDIVEMMGM